ncbi:MAG: Uma2 family endonuclease [Tepidiformaceae bacterium]
MAIRPAPTESTGRSRYDGQRMSPEEYLNLPEEKPYLEYFEGRVVQKAMPRRSHGQLQGALSHFFFLYQRAAGGSFGTEVRSWFDSSNVPAYRLPDLSYWAPAKAPGDEAMSLPPTLAVEIRSSSESMRTQRAKCRFYREHGVDVCWLIDPESRTAEVFDSVRDGAVLVASDSLESSALPGFSLPLHELFAVLDS